MNGRFVLINVCMISLLLLGFYTNSVAKRYDEIIAVQQFVRTIPYHGLNYEKAKSFNSTVVSTLVEMLNDQEERMFWPNIITTLAIIGDDDALKGITEFLKVKGPLSEASLRGKTSALYSLGIWIHKSQEGKITDKQTKVINTLIDCFRASLSNEKTNTQMDNYLKSLIKNIPDDSKDVIVFPLPKDENQKHQLNRAAVLGLAMSGDEEVLNKISNPKPISNKSMHSRSQSVEGSEPEIIESQEVILENPIDPDLFEEASKINQAIKNYGYDCYAEQKAPNC